MLGGDEVVLEFRGLGFGAGENVVDGLGDVDLRGIDATGHGGKAVELAGGGELEGGGGEASLGDEGGHDAVVLGEEGVEEVPRVDLGVVATASFGLGVGNSLLGHAGERGWSHEDESRMGRAKEVRLWSGGGKRDAAASRWPEVGRRGAGGGALECGAGAPRSMLRRRVRGEAPRWRRKDQ